MHPVSSAASWTVLQHNGTEHTIFHGDPALNAPTEAKDRWALRIIQEVALAQVFRWPRSTWMPTETSILSAPENPGCRCLRILVTKLGE